ncbi:MAG: excinuclease ABC subunit UvrC [Clostridia bacterium]|nr:excinuclease ABC subunit UvrC [Clostridia bacterium]MDD4408706.1 excinuclease ABC subunit UvrC [Clostridia bacterium]
MSANLINENLNTKLSNLSSSSGVYLMRDKEGNVIYIGKAKNLKKRVSQYFKNKHLNKNEYAFKTKTMIDKVFDFDYFITLSELDALALESNLIKKHQPFYNILLKDGKAFPYIKINLNEPFPKLEIVRKIKNDGAKYFGPYFGGVSANEILNIIHSAFKIRNCNIKIKMQNDEKTPQNNKKTQKKPQRECLNYMLGLCPAPCTNKISVENYKKTIDKVIDFLNGNDTLTEKILTEKMMLEAEKENFEKALELRNRIKIVQRLKEKVIAQVPLNKSIDVFAYETNNLSSAISFLVVRGGKILGLQTISTIDASPVESETLSSFINQYYENAALPEVILLSHKPENITELKEHLLNKKFGGIDNFFKNNHKNSNLIENSSINSKNKNQSKKESNILKSKKQKLEISTGRKNYEKMLLKMASTNAKEHLEKSLTREKSKFNNTIGAIQNLKKILNLKKTPKRIECYDISNTQGTNSVASMAVFINGEKASKHYRKFKIKTVDGANDFESLKEVISRRLAELEKGEDESFAQKPDLIVIDGGKGQLSATFEILQPFNDKHNIEIEIISIAEKFEEVFKPNESNPYILKFGSVELRILQNIRDEAHRFANTFHRNLRQKKSLESPLEKIKGIGKVKRKALIKQFKTIEAIKDASIIELASVNGINKSLAQKIKNFFKEN